MDKDKLAQMRARRYAELKAAAPDLYRQAIEAAEGVNLKHNLDIMAAVDCEDACVYIAHRALGL